MKKIVPIILGPTASGKTAVAISLARQLDGEIISADSRQIYLYLDIGTAKPSECERARIPHHLIDICEPDENWTLSRFKQAAQEIIIDIHQREKLPICVGGTGQYVNALTQGWVIPKIEE